MERTEAEKMLTDEQRDEADRNMPLFMAINKAKRFPMLEQDEQFQEGFIAFAGAVREFQGSRGYALSTLASRCVVNRLITATRKVERRRRALPCSSNTTEAVRSTCDSADDEACRTEVVIAVRRALSSLGERERDIVANMAGDRFGLGRMMSKHHLSRHKVRKIYYDACDKLRTQLAAFA